MIPKALLEASHGRPHAISEGWRAPPGFGASERRRNRTQFAPLGFFAGFRAAVRNRADHFAPSTRRISRKRSPLLSRAQRKIFPSATTHKVEMFTSAASGTSRTSNGPSKFPFPSDALDPRYMVSRGRGSLFQYWPRQGTALPAGMSVRRLPYHRNFTASLVTPLVIIEAASSTTRGLPTFSGRSEEHTSELQ